MSDHSVALYLWRFPIRWYSLAYLSAFMLGWLYVKRVGLWFDEKYSDPSCVDDFIFYLVPGVILGGRLGYVLFYDPIYYFSHPVDILCLWQGGMSFHGGFLGVLVGTFFIAKKWQLNYLRMLDILSPIVSLGLMCGRLANFANGELFGKKTNLPWGMRFDRGGEILRHPTQIYEAMLEGLLPFMILHILLSRRPKQGLVAGFFALMYGVARILIEILREPDAHIGYIMGYFTAGQLLSAPMIVVGVYFVARILLGDKQKNEQSFSVNKSINE